MEAVAATAPPPDDALAARTGIGDRHAFEALYEPHFEGVFDFALRVVRDRDVAAVVVQNAFDKALTAEDASGEVESRLYGIARSAALDHRRYRRRPSRWVEEAREGLDFTSVEARRLADPSAVLFDRELIELVWDTAVAMDTEDYSLLDLHVRRRLGAGELAEHLGLSVDALASKFARLYDSFEDSVRTVLLARRVRGSCVGLDYALTELGEDAATPAVRRAVQRHLRECGACRESKRRLASPAEVLGSFAPMAPPRGLREHVTAPLSAGENGHVSSNRLRRLRLRHSVATPGG